MEQFGQRISLVSKFVSQLIHVVSCGWWRGNGGSMWGHPSTNHNLPHKRVVAQIVPQVVARELLLDKM